VVAVKSTTNTTIVWDITLCSLLCLPPAFTLVFCLAYSSNLKMKTICSSEKSVEFQRSTRRYILKDITLPTALCLLVHVHFYFFVIRPNDNFTFSLRNKINCLCNENRSLED
jgi:hypothetical protein